MKLRLHPVESNAAPYPSFRFYGGDAFFPEIHLSGIKDGIVVDGHGPASQLRFLDDLPGPHDLECRPGRVYPVFDEAEFAKHPPQC